MEFNSPPPVPRPMVPQWLRLRRNAIFLGVNGILGFSTTIIYDGRFFNGVLNFQQNFYEGMQRKLGE